MHDIADLEDRGIPGAFIASSEFIDAAETQAEALGHDTARIFVQHPIQDRTDEEVEALANKAINEIVQAVTA